MADEVTPSVLAAAATLPPKSLMAVSLSMRHCKGAYGSGASTLTGRRVLIGAMTLQERIEEVMAAKNWQVHHVAAAAGVSSAAVSQWIGRGGKKQTKSIGNFEVALKLEKASGYSARWLAKGIGPKLVSPNGLGVETRMSQNVTAAQNDVEHTVAHMEIPVAMPYSAPNLRSAILLMGNLLGALDARSKSIIGDMLKDLAAHTDDAEDIANKASALATVQRPITNDAALDKALKGRQAVETSHGPLR